MIELLTAVSADVFVSVVPQLVNPVPEAPPGAEFFQTIMNWLMWIAIVMGGIGLIVAVIIVMAGTMDGRSTQGFRAFMMVCAGLVMLGVIGQVINTFLG